MELAQTLVAKACVDVLPKDPSTFSVDNVRICKILGSSLHSSHVVNGFVMARDSEGLSLTESHLQRV